MAAKGSKQHVVLDQHITGGVRCGRSALLPLADESTVVALAEQLGDLLELHLQLLTTTNFSVSAVWCRRCLAVVLLCQLLLLHATGRATLGVSSGLDLADLLQGAGQRVEVVGGVEVVGRVEVASLPQAKDERRGTRLLGKVAQVPEGEEPTRPSR